jgi:glutathione-regulated potassium-efflux system ancillary protein KefF
MNRRISGIVLLRHHVRHTATMILILYAHPYPTRSRAGRALLDAARDVPNVSVRSLYDLYPDFDIDVQAEQAALSAAETIVFLHPVYWYSVPAMLKHYFDVVFARGWAYAKAGGNAVAGDGDALRGKRCLWVATTGGTQSGYAQDAMHARPFHEYALPIKQTAEFCGMVWQPPISLHGAHVISDDEVAEAAELLRARLHTFVGARDAT